MKLAKLQKSPKNFKELDEKTREIVQKVSRLEKAKNVTRIVKFECHDKVCAIECLVRLRVVIGDVLNPLAVNDDGVREYLERMDRLVIKVTDVQKNNRPIDEGTVGRFVKRHTTLFKTIKESKQDRDLSLPDKLVWSDMLLMCSTAYFPQ